jgi:hypothetical protein
MKQSGENVVRIDFDYVYPQRKEYRGLESKPGVLNSEQVEKIDTVFRLAAKHGIRVHVVPFVTSPPMGESWKRLNPMQRKAEAHRRIQGSEAILRPRTARLPGPSGRTIEREGKFMTVSIGCAGSR